MAFPAHDGEVAAFARDLDLPGIVDVHVHFLPERLQQAVWAYFDRLDDPPWPITYRDDEPSRLGLLRDLGVVRHTALAYAHKSGMVADLNDHTLGLAERHPAVIPTFTIHPDEDIEEHVGDALARGGTVCKVHLQVGKFDALHPRLLGVWAELQQRRIPVVLHASAVYGVDGGGEYCGPDVVRGLLDRYPELTLVVAHLGAPDVSGFLDLVPEAPAVYLDTAGALTDPPCQWELPDDVVARLRGHADRLVFGSDFPSVPYTYAAQVRGLRRLQLTREGYRGLFHDTATALLERAEPGG